MANYKLDYDYLINLNKYSRFDNIIKIRIVGLTKTCYEVLWVQSGNKSYELIEKFDDDYVLVEELGTPIPNISDYITKIKTTKNIL
jgi:hypothetical protein